VLSARRDAVFAVPAGSRRKAPLLYELLSSIHWARNSAISIGSRLDKPLSSFGNSAVPPTGHAVYAAAQKTRPGDRDSQLLGNAISACPHVILVGRAKGMAARNETDGDLGAYCKAGAGDCSGGSSLTPLCTAAALVRLLDQFYRPYSHNAQAILTEPGKVARWLFQVLPCSWPHL